MCRPAFYWDAKNVAALMRCSGIRDRLLALPRPPHPKFANSLRRSARRRDDAGRVQHASNAAQRDNARQARQG